MPRISEASSEFPSYHAVKQKMMNSLLFWAKQTFITFNRFSFFSTLSLLSNLFLETNQRKKWTLGGTINFQTAGIDWHYTSKVNNRIKWLWRVNSWWIDLNCHTNESSSSYKEIELAGCTVSAHKFINLSSTHRLKVHFTFNPSRSSATVVVFSLTMLL